MLQSVGMGSPDVILLLLVACADVVLLIWLRRRRRRILREERFHRSIVYAVRTLGAAPAPRTRTAGARSAG